jgi:integrase
VGADLDATARHLADAEDGSCRERRNGAREPVKSIRAAWENATEAAGLKGFQLGDLRHEAGSRFEEAGVPVSNVSRLLGHTNLSTTVGISTSTVEVFRWRCRNWRSIVPQLHKRCTLPSQTHKAMCRPPQEQPAPKPHVVQ